VLGNRVWTGELAPLLAAGSLGLQTAQATVVAPVDVTATIHQLPNCALPGAGSPAVDTLAFNAGATGVANSNAPFDWLQSGVLSVHHADASVVTYIATTRSSNSGGRVTAIKQFADGTQVLCAGLDAPQ
jgi:hypothetical protein